MKYKFKNLFSNLSAIFYTKMLPEKFVQSPQLMHFNDELGSFLNIDRNDFQTNLQKWIEAEIEGCESLAMVYAGHQFGHYVPRLGDGRALLLAQIEARDHKLYDLQLKGSGLTPYSRMGDGRAVLRSCIREYLCGEAMYHLGVQTTRALALIATGENVLREEVEMGSMILRVAKSHIRFGHFEYFYYTGQHEALKTLADHVIENYFPQLNAAENKYEKFLQQVITLTATMIAKWQAIGFCHGVMNTDNMSILGDTIDYGPYGFLENYDPHWICNHSDNSGRYAYQEQPIIANWNIYALSFALQPLIPLEESAKIAQNFFSEFEAQYFELMRQKIGFTKDKSVDEIWQNLLQIMREEKVDYTLTFVNLAKTVEGNRSSFLKLFKNKNKIEFWLENYLQIVQKDQALDLMRKINPQYILRNWVLQTAIEKMQREADNTAFEELFAMIKNPFTENYLYKKYAVTAPENYRDLSVSCSS
ncbi:MAG: YdiU family protein [Rickettsiales bacterium]|nr:YdiU family protein [Rickettsiales bacterium]